MELYKYVLPKKQTKTNRMRIRIIGLMLCLLAASMLIFSSCQKEEKELLETPSAVPPADVQTSHAEDDACGAILYENEMAQRRMEAMENRVQNFIHDNPDAVSSGART